MVPRNRAMKLILVGVCLAMATVAADISTGPPTESTLATSTATSPSTSSSATTNASTPPTEFTTSPTTTTTSVSTTTTSSSTPSSTSASTLPTEFTTGQTTTSSTASTTTSTTSPTTSTISTLPTETTTPPTTTSTVASTTTTSTSPSTTPSTVPTETTSQTTSTTTVPTESTTNPTTQTTTVVTQTTTTLPPTEGPTTTLPPTEGSSTTVSSTSTTPPTTTPTVPTCNVNTPDTFPHPSDCSLYYTCSNGNLFLQSCPQGLVFNPISKVCDWPANVDCGNAAIKELPSSQPTSCPAVDVAGETVRIPHETNCNYYYLCNNGSSLLYRCADEMHLNPLTRVCALADEAGCNSCPKVDVPSQTVRLPHEDNCNFYYLCNSGNFTLYRCANDNHLSPILRICLDPNEAGCEPATVY